MRSYKLAGALAVVATLNCVTAFCQASEASADRGFVRVSLPIAAAKPKVRVQAAGGQSIELLPQANLGPGQYGQWVSPGEYSVEGLVAADGGKYPTFQVRAGNLTNLGALVELQIGGYEVLTLPVHHAETDEAASFALAQLKPQLTGDAIEWRPALSPRSRKLETPWLGLGLVADLLMEYDRHVNRPPVRQLIKEAKTVADTYRLAVSLLPPVTDEVAVDDQGAQYYGAELGQIKVRNGSGQWTNLDTGTLQTVTAVEASGDTLLAGTADGSLRISKDRGQRWSKVATLEAREVVVDIDRVGERWLILSSPTLPVPVPLVATVERIHVHAATDDTLASPQSIRKIELAEKLFLQGGIGIRGQLAKGGYLINGHKELIKLDPRSMQWSTLKAPHAVHGFNVDRNSDAITVYRLQGMFSKLSVSTDGGETWRPRDTPPYTVYDVNFETAELGIATRWSSGAFSVAIEFMRYEAAKDRWTKTHDAPPGCARLIRDAQNALRYCLTSGGSILNFVDGKWVVEFAAN